LATCSGCFLLKSLDATLFLVIGNEFRCQDFSSFPFLPREDHPQATISHVTLRISCSASVNGNRGSWCKPPIPRVCLGSLGEIADVPFSAPDVTVLRDRCSPHRPWRYADRQLCTLGRIVKMVPTLSSFHGTSPENILQRLKKQSNACHESIFHTGALGELPGPPPSLLWGVGEGGLVSPC
jgi:hypothetical protein